MNLIIIHEIVAYDYGYLKEQMICSQRESGRVYIYPFAVYNRPII